MKIFKYALYFHCSFACFTCIPVPYAFVLSNGKIWNFFISATCRGGAFTRGEALIRGRNLFILMILNTAALIRGRRFFESRNLLEEIR